MARSASIRGHAMSLVQLITIAGTIAIITTTTTDPSGKKRRAALFHQLRQASGHRPLIPAKTTHRSHYTITMFRFDFREGQRLELGSNRLLFIVDTSRTAATATTMPLTRSVMTSATDLC